MRRGQTIQTCGSILVIGGFAGAELSAHLLNRFPNWVPAWYIHLVVFRPFEHARAIASFINPFVGPTALTCSTIFALLALIAGVVRSRLGIAVIAHLAFAASVDLTRAWITDDRTGELSLAVIQDRGCVGTCLVGALLGVAALTCAVSHLTFAIDIRADAKEETKPVRHWHAAVPLKQVSV